MSKEDKKNYIIGTIVWVLYGLVTMGLVILLDHVFIYSGLFTYWKRTAVEVVIILVVIGIGFLGYYSKIDKGYFIKKGLI